MKCHNGLFHASHALPFFGARWVHDVPETRTQMANWITWKVGQGNPGYKWRDMGSEHGVYFTLLTGVKYHPSYSISGDWGGLVFYLKTWQIGECPPSIIQLCKLEWVDEFLTNTKWSWLKVLVVSSRSNRDVCRKMTCITNPRDLAASIAAYLFFLRMTHTHRNGAVWKKQRWQKIYPNRPNSGDALMVSLVKYDKICWA